MNIFGKFYYLLLIYFIFELKCDDNDNNSDKIKLFISFNETYLININQSNNSNIISNYYMYNNIFDNNIYYESEKKIKPENIYFGRIKLIKNEAIFRNFPRENDTDITFGYSENRETFKPWPNEAFNSDYSDGECNKFKSIIDFEFDDKDNIYILDEGKKNDCPIKLFKFKSSGELIWNIPIIETEENVNVTNFVIDTKNKYAYIAYNYLDNNNNYEIGIYVLNINDDKKKERKLFKKIKLEDQKLKYDDNYELKNKFINNFANIDKKILSLALSCDSEVLFFCPLSSRKIYSVLTETILKEGVNNINLTLSMVNEAYKNDATSALVSSNLGNLYLTGIEENNTIYVAGQIDNDLTIFNYKGIEKIKGNGMHFQTDLSISNGTLYIICKDIIHNDDNFIVTTNVYLTDIDKEKSYVYKCAGLAFKWDFKSFIIWGIFLFIVCFVLVFVFIENKEDKDINKKNN